MTTNDEQLGREDGASDFIHPWLDLINKTPKLMSLLYDIDMLPEQCKTRLGATRMVGVCLAWCHQPSSVEMSLMPEDTR